jgi:signal transduction histidine kinase
MSRSLVSKTLENEGILEALEELVEFSSVKNRTIEFNHNNGVSFLNTRQELAIYRIAQEAINNAIKYAKSEIIFVKLEIDGEDFNLIVSDNGIGFQWSEFRRSLGLSNMQIRAEEIGAILKIEAAPEKGTKIILTSNEQYQSPNS